MIEIDIKKKLHGSNGDMSLNISLHIAQNEFLALSGKSGSGKTTFLRVLAGLEEATGRIVVDGTIWLDKNYSLAVQKREIGFVFQDSALFLNMSVEENLLFVKRDKALVKELLEITELSSLAKRYPKTLSGGQQQRVNLCRAMMNKPKLLLMDEPFSALDPLMRLKLQNEILILHKRFNTTTIMVSHDLSEIYHLSSRMLVLESGTIIEDGKAQNILVQKEQKESISFDGEIVDIRKGKNSYFTVISIGQQLVEVEMSFKEIQLFQVRERVRVKSKAFSLIIEKK